MDITHKMVLGTAQFGMDYGIANIAGKPTQKEVFNILSLAWESGIRCFDTAPDYGSEKLLGEFITTYGLQDEIRVLTKIPSLERFYEPRECIQISIETSLRNLCCPIHVLFFHNAEDSVLMLEDPDFFRSLLNDYPVSTLGVSVYEPQDVEKLSSCLFELAFQFPFNVLDRRFEQVRMPHGKRYARSIFLQGILARKNGLRSNTPKELIELQKEYHEKLAAHHLNPSGFAVSFVALNDTVDHFLIGVDSVKQLRAILNLKQYEQYDMAVLDMLSVGTDKQWLDPRTWN